jgi:hypothetical protein
MHYKRLLNNDWKDIEEMVENEKSCWKCNITSIGYRLITSYMISFSMM